MRNLERSKARNEPRRRATPRIFAFVLAAACSFASSASSDEPPKHAVNGLGMKFVWIRPGSFTMGSPPEEIGRGDNESQRKVTLTKGFYLGVHLVTQEQWKAANMPNNFSSFKDGEKLPVDTVSWDDCVDFCKKLRDMDGKPYRLPTEAEWEYACRAGTTTPFWFGDSPTTDRANYDGDAVYGNGKKGLYRAQTTPIEAFPPNPWGLYDMHGNLWQWCEDWYADYPKGDAVDPQGPSKGKYRVLRGGAWDSDPSGLRAAYRYGFVPTSRRNYFGVRVCYADK